METSSAWKDKMTAEAFIHGRRAAIPNAADQLNVMLHILRHNEMPVTSFIDLGTGDGILCQLILEQLAGTKGYAVDFSPPMLEAAHQRLDPYANRIQIINADISAPGWQKNLCTCGNEKVDAVVSGYCIHHLKDERKYQLYSEIYDLLNPSGLFINIEHVASHSLWGEMLSDEAFIDSIQAHESSLPEPRSREKISNDFYSRADKKENLLVPLETQCGWLKTIGFKEVDVFFKCYELAVFAGKKI